MTDIRTETIPLVDGSELRLTIAEPVSSVRGGIVVLHEARGVTDAVRWLVHGLAGDGWLAVAPHLHHDEEPVQAQGDRLERDQVMADTDTAFGWLAERDIDADRMGVIGFDFGGSVALLVAATRTMGAAVTVAGTGSAPLSSSMPSLIAAASGLTCPWLGIYGESAGGEADPEIEQLRKAATKSEVAADVIVYPQSGYRFDDDPDAAAEAWERTLNWFDSNLR